MGGQITKNRVLTLHTGDPLSLGVFVAVYATDTQPDRSAMPFQGREASKPQSYTKKYHGFENNLQRFPDEPSAAIAKYLYSIRMI